MFASVNYVMYSSAVMVVCVPYLVRICMLHRDDEHGIKCGCVDDELQPYVVALHMMQHRMLVWSMNLSSHTLSQSRIIQDVT